MENHLLDSFISDFNNPFRRKRLSAIFKKYGMLPVLGPTALLSAPQLANVAKGIHNLGGDTMLSSFTNEMSELVGDDIVVGLDGKETKKRTLFSRAMDLVQKSGVAMGTIGAVAGKAKEVTTEPKAQNEKPKPVARIMGITKPLFVTLVVVVLLAIIIVWYTKSKK